MLKYILMILGGVILSQDTTSCSRMKAGEDDDVLFVVTYAGLTLVILSGARVLDPFFEGLGKNGR